MGSKEDGIDAWARCEMKPFGRDSNSGWNKYTANYFYAMADMLTPYHLQNHTKAKIVSMLQVNLEITTLKLRYIVVKINVLIIGWFIYLFLFQYNMKLCAMQNFFT